jgi:hypothetical protein
MMRQQSAAATVQPGDAAVAVWRGVWRQIGAPLDFPETWNEEQRRIGLEESLLVDDGARVQINPELVKHQLFARGGRQPENAIFVGAIMGLTEGEVFVLLEQRN